jgi:cytochrome P450
MSETLAPTLEKAPDHVPPELAFPFRVGSLPGIEERAFQAVIGAFRERPDIFFAVGGARSGPGTWIVTRHDLVREVLMDSDNFESRGRVDISSTLGEDLPLIPIEMDPPEHVKWRAVLDPIFSPKRMKALEADIRQLAIDLVEDVRAKGGCEFVQDFSSKFPTQIFLRLLGLPLEEAPKFLAWEHAIFRSGDSEKRKAAYQSILATLRTTIEARKRAPTEDAISYVATVKFEGRPLTDKEMAGVCMILYLAGLDSVAGMLGFMFTHLAEHPADQQRLRDNPEQITDGMEEMLRAFPISSPARVVKRDLEFHGVNFKAGDIVTAYTISAGRDAREYKNPDKVDFDREEASHITFGVGPHRCLGSHLARRELRIAIEEWLKRVPPFHITPGETVVTNGNSILGVMRLPLSW